MKDNWKICLFITCLILISASMISGCIDNNDNEEKYGRQLIEIKIENQDDSDYSLIVPIAQSGLEKEPIVNSKFTIIEGSANFSISENEYGNGLQIVSKESITIKAESDEYVSIQPTMWKDGGYWFFCNTSSNNLIISYKLYSFTSIHSNTHDFWIDDYSLKDGWNNIELNMISKTE